MLLLVAAAFVINEVPEDSSVKMTCLFDIEVFDHRL
jgi:hypothetical protein